jgi:hypothetical protein
MQEIAWYKQLRGAMKKYKKFLGTNNLDLGQPKKPRDLIYVKEVWRFLQCHGGYKKLCHAATIQHRIVQRRERAPEYIQVLDHEQMK